MGLELYKDGAGSKVYENSFFRSFAATLKALFERQKLNGVLIGFSFVPEVDNFWPDCLLITENRIVIIDFKHCNSTNVHLPSEDRFESDSWGTDYGHVSAGSKNNANPFDQLKKQERRLTNKLGYIPNEDVQGVGCIVVFDSDIRIVGKIAGVCDGWFSVADCNSFGNAVYDMVDLRSKNKNDPEELRKKYFPASEYISNIPTIDLDKYISMEESSQEFDKLRDERDRIKQELDEQKKENKRMREDGQSVEEGIRRIKQKEEQLNKIENELKEQQKDFDEKKNAYDIAVKHFETEVEKTKQEEEKTKQAKANQDIERQKAKQEQARAKTAELEYEQNMKSEKRKSITAGVVLTIALIMILVAIILKITDMNSTADQNRREREEQEQALIEDKKAGKTCIEISELKDFVGTKNACVEFIVGDVADRSNSLYLNRTVNTDFAAVIWKSSNIIDYNTAKNMYLNKRIRVRGTITYYDTEKYKYHRIVVSDLSQIEILDQ